MTLASEASAPGKLIDLFQLGLDAPTCTLIRAQRRYLVELMQQWTRIKERRAVPA